MSYEKFVINEHAYYKTYSTASEAFKDADYASPITYFESNGSRTLRYMADHFGTFLIGLVFGMVIRLFI